MVKDESVGSLTNTVPAGDFGLCDALPCACGARLCGSGSSGSGGLSRYDAGVGANVPSGRGSPVNLDGALVVVAQVNKLLDIPTQPRYPAIVDLASRGHVG